MRVRLAGIASSRGARTAALHLEGTDVQRSTDNPGESRPALVPLRPRTNSSRADLAPVDRRAVEQEGVRPGGAAIVLQRAEQGIDIEQVGRVITAPALAVTEQIVARENEQALQVRAFQGHVTRHDCVAHRKRALRVHPAAEFGLIA